MKNKKFDPFKNLILNEFEQEIEDDLGKGKYVSDPKFKENKKLFEEAARIYKVLNNTKRITLRVKHEDLIKVKVKAKKHRIPYQTLIGAIIHQFAEGKTNIII